MSRSKSKAKKERREEQVTANEPARLPPSGPPEDTGRDGKSPSELPPSSVRPDEPFVARLIGLLGLALTMLGGVAILISFMGRVSRLVSPELGGAFLILGLAGLLFHAVRDADIQFRRTYAAVGYALLLAAVILAFLPLRPENAAAPIVGAAFLRFGLPFAFVGLLFLLAFLRNEDEAVWVDRTVGLFALIGVVAAGFGLIGGAISQTFLLPQGLVAALLGLAFLGAYVGSVGADTNAGHRGGLLMGVAGGVTLGLALGRSLLPALFYQWHWIANRPTPYLVPAGLLLAGVGLMYLILAVGLVSDWPLFVMTRRELMAYFYSPIAYIVMLVSAIFCWAFFVLFAAQLDAARAAAQPIMEPIIYRYLVQWLQIIFLMIVGVPLLTMRLLSEERATGTYEMLMTAPVRETTVVLSKFLGVFLFYLLMWMPMGVYLLGLRVSTGQDFEYRPLFAFGIGIACMGAGFLSMGLFFSSLTRSQIAAAVLTVMAMMLMTLLGIVKFVLQDEPFKLTDDNVWIRIMGHISYLDVWVTTLSKGIFVPKYMIFHLSAAVFWLFATTKVLEARKWT